MSQSPPASPVLLDEPRYFSNTQFTAIQEWLRAVATEQKPLLSPIHLSESPRACLSRKRRALDDGNCRATRRARVVHRACTPWGLPPTRRFFDSPNWMDEADDKLKSLPAEAFPWSDAYTVMISQPLSRQRRPHLHHRSPRRTSLGSSHCAALPSLRPIVIPVCPPLTPKSPLCTPARPRRAHPYHPIFSDIPTTPALTPPGIDRSPVDDRYHVMPITPCSSEPHAFSVVNSP